MKLPGADAQISGRREPEPSLGKAREDRIDPQEQAAIERHLATRGVTRVPMGQQHYDASQTRPREVRDAEARRKSARDRKFARLRDQAQALEAPRDPAPSAAPAAKTLSAPEPLPAARPAPPPPPPAPAVATADPGLDRLPAVRVEIERPGFIPAWDAACRFEMVPVARLRVRSGGYQRQLGRNSARRVKRLAEGFDWARFGALVVRECGTGEDTGGFEIIDGQHRAAAARARGIRAVPAIVVAGEGAGVFLGLNRDRAALDSAQLYHAEMAAAEPEAAALAALLDRVGIVVPRAQTQRGLGPMETRAVSALRLELRARGPALLESGLRAMACAWARVPGAFTVETIRGCLLAAAAIRAEADDAELARLADTLGSFDPAALRASARSQAAKYGGTGHAHLARLVCNAHAERGGVAVAVGV